MPSESPTNAPAMKRVLMVAYHFPPMAGSSGVQRTLRFAQYLSEFGWQPLVLSTQPIAYEDTSDDLLKDIPPEAIVHRSFALDTARHLSLGGRYFDFMAQPDRWVCEVIGLRPQGVWKKHAGIMPLP
jgi:hypothetical protein